MTSNSHSSTHSFSATQHHGRTHTRNSRPRNPIVGYGARNVKVEWADIGEGAFSAVSRNVSIRRASVPTPYHRREFIAPPADDDSLSHGTSNSPTPSVLYAFHRHNTNPSAHGVTFGKGSYSAVSRRSVYTRREGKLSLNDSDNVLHNQSRLPPASRIHTGSFYAPGSHSAIGSAHQRHEPNVLMWAENFICEGGTFEAGSFSAVGGEQLFEEPDLLHYEHRRRC
ncbi:hypothetical protein J3R30DRAFT_3700740 [Lentinula aciculospora]|uniref:Uncharacterized protein n=1 Tax=Lentinula aciculospora TaxID=153920 RepID=A0A9W9DQ66_9AGAR|nr:hypothetical protein J3R30DRAFT_3700740 [Lentinula aciculospora]